MQRMQILPRRGRLVLPSSNSQKHAPRPEITQHLTWEDRVQWRRGSNGSKRDTSSQNPDFGLSRIFNKGKKKVQATKSMQKESSKAVIKSANWMTVSKRKGFVGTPRWMAPEMMKRKSRSALPRYLFLWCGDVGASQEESLGASWVTSRRFSRQSKMTED